MTESRPSDKFRSVRSIELRVWRGDAVDSWREGRQNAARAEQALTSFEAEIRRNKAALEAILPYHLQLQEEFARLSATGEIRKFEDLGKVKGFRGFRPAFLEDTAWRTAVATGTFGHLDYKTVQVLSRLYTAQESMLAHSGPRRPEFGVLSAMAHGESEQGATIAAAVLPAIRGLDDDRARFYYDLVYNSMNHVARRALETMMKGYQYQSDFAKKYVAQGHAEGRTEGRTEATALNLLTVLRVRGIAVPNDVRERILAQKDPERLERWLEKAAVASSVAAVLDESN
jgi:hypothetical protein